MRAGGAGRCTWLRCALRGWRAGAAAWWVAVTVGRPRWLA
nr:MAG TPA: hypothetical protein [Caudoviricetes sp.]